MMNDVLENQLLSNWARLLPRRPDQVGAIHEADCELVPIGDEMLLATTIDSIDEEIDAGLYTDPRTAGRMAAVATLSDLAAVGADPIGLLLSVTLPSKGVQAEVAAGVAAACANARTHVLGGDTSEGPVLRIACAGLGLVPAATVLRRVGLAPGDHLFASGLLGSGAALAATKLFDVDGEADFHPTSRVAFARGLRGIASACIDTSDGFVAALDQLARLNDVVITVDADTQTLLSPAADRVRRALGASAFPLLASAHGEYELVFGVPPGRLRALRELARALDWRPIEVGVVRAGRGLVIDGRPIDGARVRNLLRECGGNIERYVAKLAEL